MPPANWIETCTKVGLQVRDLDLMDLYSASGGIERKMREFQGPPENRDFSKLTPEQQAAVRAAAYAAIPAKKK